MCYLFFFHPFTCSIRREYFSLQFNLKRGGQRVATMLMYLTDNVEGGETIFPMVRVSFLLLLTCVLSYKVDTKCVVLLHIDHHGAHI